jgi:hypothetical protein
MGRGSLRGVSVAIPRKVKEAVIDLAWDNMVYLKLVGSIFKLLWSSLKHEQKRVVGFINMSGVTFSTSLFHQCLVPSKFKQPLTSQCLLA